MKRAPEGRPWGDLSFKTALKAGEGGMSFFSEPHFLIIAKHPKQNAFDPVHPQMPSRLSPLRGPASLWPYAAHRSGLLLTNAQSVDSRRGSYFLHEVLKI
jgi:hypothetical protein